MANLMSGSYTYDELKKKYDDFEIPIVKIKVNGMDVVSTLKLAVVHMKMTLSIEAASMVVLKLGDQYDLKSHTFESKVKSEFAIGTVVEVEVGYKSTTLDLFKGFVAALGAEFSEVPLIVVTLMDARRLMMLAGNQVKLHDVKNYSDVFHTIMSRYSRLCSTSVDATSDNLVNPLSQTQDDYQFITRELIASGRADREFFILGNIAYFRKPHKEKTSIMTLEYGRELLALKTDEWYRDLNIEVVGYDADQQKTVSGKASVKTPFSMKKLIGNTPELYLTDPAMDTVSKAKDKAQSIADKLEYKAKTGQGMTIGIPEIVPGRYITVKSLDKDLCDHKFYLKSVIHEINGTDYKTMFDIEGWES